MTTGTNTVEDKPLSVEGVLGPGGILSKAMKGYEYRHQQLKMAHGVDKAIEKRGVYVVEAATGTGKTMAYLIPAILSGKQVVISTGTKALQDQIINKDIPFLRKHLPVDFKATVLKGWSNYLCKKEFVDYEATGAQQTIASDGKDPYEDIVAWANSTRSGDKSELSTVSERHEVWSDLTVSTDMCAGKKCLYFKECFAVQAKERARKSEVVIVNHHLLLLDLYHGGMVIPVAPDLVVFDEAHHLEDVATSAFSEEFSSQSCQSIQKLILKKFKDAGVNTEGLHGSIGLINGLVNKASEILEMMGRRTGDKRLNAKFALRSMDPVVRKDMFNLVKDFESDIESVANRVTRETMLDSDDRQQLTRKLDSLENSLKICLLSDDDAYARTFDNTDESKRKLIASPVDVSAFFQRYVLDMEAVTKASEKDSPGDEEERPDNWTEAIVMTSATLAAGKGGVDKFCGQLGLSNQYFHQNKRLAFAEVLPEVFDYEHNCALYIPTDKGFPTPKQEEFVQHAATRMREMVERMEGRAFLLFTSYRNMNAVYEAIGYTLSKSFTVMKQGQYPKGEIVKRFKADPSSVLFATASFWEGVDIPGESLSLVVMDKLPFPNYTDPLVEARSEMYETRGQNSFYDYMLPKAAISLKQGFGRLIRNKTDKGIVAVLDRRIAEARYGKFLLSSLPPAVRYNNLDGLFDWWKRQQ